MAQAAVDDRFVLIVDDWNWREVRAGTLAALAETRIQLDFVAEIRTSLDDSHPVLSRQHSDWHNGYFIGVCSKPG